MLKGRLLRTQGHFLHMQTNCPLSATCLEPAPIFLETNFFQKISTFSTFWMNEKTLNNLEFKDYQLEALQSSWDIIPQLDLIEASDNKIN